VWRLPDNRAPEGLLWCNSVFRFCSRAHFDGDALITIMIIIPLARLRFGAREAPLNFSGGVEAHVPRIWLKTVAKGRQTFYLLFIIPFMPSGLL